eukprot:4989852-Amphidinium_carterae.1
MPEVQLKISVAPLSTQTFPAPTACGKYANANDDDDDKDDDDDASYKLSIRLQSCRQHNSEQGQRVS